jgi:hypothetical protein
MYPMFSPRKPSCLGEPRDTPYVFESPGTSHLTSLHGHHTCLFEIVQPMHALVTWEPGLLLYSIVPHDEGGFDYLEAYYYWKVSRCKFTGR